MDYIFKYMITHAITTNLDKLYLMRSGFSGLSK